MFRKTYANSERSFDDDKWSLATIVAVFLIEFLLPSALTSYGVFFTYFVEDGYFTFYEGMWAPIVYIASWNIASPWCQSICEHLEENEQRYSKHFSVLGVCFVVSGILLSSLFHLLIIQIISYGILGGIGTSIIICQLRSSAYEAFQSNPQIIGAIVQVGRALGVFVLPHVCLLIVSLYGVFEAQAIFAVVLLHIIPARLLISRKKKKEVTSGLLRYQTGTYLCDQEAIELPTITRRLGKRTKKHNGHSSLNSISYENCDEDDDSSSDSDSYSLEEIEEEPQPEPPVPSPRCKTQMGVEILPQIPEENESDEDSPSANRFNLGIKRLSTLSFKFEAAIDKSDRKGTAESLDDAVDSRTKHRPFRDFQRPCSYMSCCSPYQKYLCRRRSRYCLGTVHDNFVKPFNASVKTFYFYPALYGKTLTAVASVIYLTSLPHIALNNDGVHKNDEREAVFLLTFTSVSWCFFLISLPWVMYMSKTRLKILHIFGLVITSLSLLMLYLSISHDMLTLSCLVFGFGFGMTSYSEEIVYRESLGVRRWHQISGTLYTLSGILVLVIYCIIYVFKLNVITIFLLLFIFISVNAVLWLFAPIIQYVRLYFKKKKNADMFLT